MTVETDLFDALKSLTTNRVYPDVAPVDAAKPYITYQQVGGEAINFMESAAPGKRNGRFQINCWAETRAAAMNLARQAEDALIESTTLRAYLLGAPVAIYEEETKLYGSRQDASIWFTS